MARDNATEHRPAGGPQPEAPEAPPTRTRAKPLLASAAIVLALGVAAMIWHATSHPAADPASTSHGADGVKTVEIDGFKGKLTVGVSKSAQISATAQPVNGNVAPGLEFRLDSTAHVLTLACFDQQANNGPIPCPATEYKVSVPEHIGLKLQLLAGQASLTGLSGPVDVSASYAYLDAEGLRTSDFTATMANGTLNAGFTTAPARVDVSVTSAQATLHLPGTVSYHVQQQTNSAYVQVSVPQDPNSDHRVLAKADSGEISLVTG